MPGIVAPLRDIEIKEPRRSCFCVLLAGKGCVRFDFTVESLRIVLLLNASRAICTE